MSVDFSSDAPPSARASPFTASAGNVVYLWGGDEDTEPDVVFLFHRDTKTWERQCTRGQHPPAGLNNGGCCISGQHLYIYGGWDYNGLFLGALYKLNTNSWTWRQLSDGGGRGPGKKVGCKMIPYQDKLFVIGGVYYEMPSSRQAGSSYDYESGLTNEVHCFNLTTGLWSSPLMKGSRPPPCSSFSLTVINEDQAMMYGGFTPSDMSSEAYILHLPTMTWTKHKEGDQWPERRSAHIAACLDYRGQHKTVLISGGWDGDGTHDDMWLLELQSGRMEKLQMPEKYMSLIQRQGHSAATFTVNSDCVEVILVGGCDRNYSLIADTTILRFEWQMKSEGSKWALTDITDDTQLGSPAWLARIREDELQRRAESAERRAEDSERRAETSERRAEYLEGRVEYLERRAEESERRAEESESRAEESEGRAEESERKAEDLERRAEDSERRAEDSERRAEDSERRAEESERRAEESERKSDESEGRAEVAEERVHNLERSLADTAQNLKQYKMMTEEIESEVLKEYPQLPVARQSEVENDDKKSVPEEVLSEETESKLLKIYPRLPVARQNEELSHIPGFNGEEEIAITYRGRKGSVQWKEAGIQLFFEETQEVHMQEATKCFVQVSKNEGAYSKLPSNAKPLSRFYHISSSKSLNNTAVTLRIFYQAAKEDIRQFCFLTSTNNAPPYNYKILYGGHFTSTYGEISVESFSLYTICQLYAYHGMKGILSYMERSYEARLYCSIQPTTLNSGYRWSIYLSVVKNCYIFTNTMKTYIQEEFEDKLKLVSKHVVIFDDAHDFITVHPNLSTNSPESVFLDEVDHESNLSKELIMHHVDGCPPLLIYRIHGRQSCSLDLKFTLKGLQKEKHFTLHQYDLPELCLKAPQQSTPIKSTSSQSRDDAFLYLKVQDLDKVLKEVIPAKAKWNFIGLELGVPIGEVEAIDGMGVDVDVKLMKTLAIWLRRGINTTWRVLAEAMGAVTVEHYDIKENILANHT